MREHVSTKELSALTGVPIGTLTMFRQQGRIQAEVPGRPLVSDLWALPQVLGIAAARAVRVRGASVEESGDLLAYLETLSVADLERHFRRGKRFILLLGQKVMPRLVRRESVEDNPVVRGCLPAAWQAGLLPTLIDAGAIWAVVKEEVAKLGEADPEPRKEKAHA